MSEATDKIKQYWNEHPMETIIITSIAVGAVTKLIEALTTVQSRRAYARQVEYRIHQPK